MISNKQNFKNEYFDMGFTHLRIKIIEKIKLKIKLNSKKNLKINFHASYAESLQLPKAV